MAPLAQLAALLGARVSGSDRNIDRGVRLPVFEALEKAGVRLLPQDGSAVEPGMDALVHSSAIETSNPDLLRAQSLGIARIRRGSFLAQLASERRTIAIAGTSGKSTVSAMIAHILFEAGLDPSYLGGAPAVDLPGSLDPGSLRVGKSEWFVVETDESDGSVAELSPAIAALTNLTRDHKEIDVTTGYFARLLAQTRERAVVHVGDPALALVPRPPRLPLSTVALEGEATWAPPDWVARSILLEPDAVRFEIAGVAARVPFPGLLTVENAAMAIATAQAAGVPIDRAAAALRSFGGVRRRLERVGRALGVDVFDDFAHNPVKIRMAIQALRPERALWIFYQPHGYGPTRFFRRELIETFRESLRPGDRLLLAPIFDAGGTADRSIRSEDIADPLSAAGVEARVVPSREEAAREISAGVRPGDRVIVMGARDDTLPLFARSVADAIAARAKETASSRAQR